MDSLTKEQRSWNMGRIRSKNTKPEILIRSALHRQGYRFRIHKKELPGKPDIILPKYKTIIFIHGCFWHRHNNCNFAYIPKTRTEWWKNKFKKNKANDKNNVDALLKAGYRVILIWECTINNNRNNINLIIDKISLFLAKKGNYIEY